MPGPTSKAPPGFAQSCTHTPCYAHVREAQGGTDSPARGTKAGGGSAYLTEPTALTAPGAPRVPAAADA